MKNSFSTPYYLKNLLKFVSYQKKGWNAEITGSKKTTLRHFFAKFEQLTIKRHDHF